MALRRHRDARRTQSPGLTPAVAAEIEFRRQQHGLSQTQLASLVGRSQGQLANALRGHDPISGRVVNRLRDVLLFQLEHFWGTVAASDFIDKGSRGSDPRLLGLTTGRLLDRTFGERPRASRIVRALGLDLNHIIPSLSRLSFSILADRQ
jgi:transcriptional regulator with XRE-family HTH domain